LLQPQNFAQSSFDAVTTHSIPNAAIDRKAKSAIRKIVRQSAQDERLIRIRPPLPPNLLESFVRADSVAPLHALVRLPQLTISSLAAIEPTPSRLVDRFAIGQLDGQTRATLEPAAPKYIATSGR